MKRSLAAVVACCVSSCVSDGVTATRPPAEAHPRPVPVARNAVDVARSAYLALRCRDIGRVDVRLDQDGRPHVIEVNPLPGLAPRYSDVCKMTESLGWPHTRVIAAVLDPAIRRRP